MPKPGNQHDPGARRTGVIYARVSSKDQAEEGYSIPAQLELLRRYAVTKGITVLKEVTDVETAKQKGRKGFGGVVLEVDWRLAGWDSCAQYIDQQYGHRIWCIENSGM
jgi:predicted site-specific integrase-resolvase